MRGLYVAATLPGALGHSVFLLPASSGNKTSEPLAVGRALLRLVPGSALPALQRERQLRSSAFPNQTDNLRSNGFTHIPQEIKNGKCLA